MKINSFGKGEESTLRLARVVGVSSSEGLVGVFGAVHCEVGLGGVGGRCLA